MFCKYCGKSINDDSIFCKYCGEEIGEKKIETAIETPEEIKEQNPDDNRATILDEQIEFERYAENMVKRKTVGIIFRIIFWLMALYVMYVSCMYSWIIRDIFSLVLKIIFFPFTITIWPLIGLISGGLYGWYFWIWFFMMGSYAISTFYGRLRPI